MLSVGLTIAGMSVIGLIYPHVIYPCLLSIIRTLFRKPVAVDDSYQPSVDVLMCAYNEEDGIGTSLTSVLTCTYPPEKMRLLVANDGSTDNTAAIVRTFAASDQRITVFDLPRSGKNQALDVLLEHATADVVLFMDADVVIAPDAIGRLVSPLADASVGGALSLNDRSDGSFTKDSGSAGEAMYRGLEGYMNQAESDVHSTVASNGALYAIRRPFVRPLMNARVADDLMMVLHTISGGSRVVFRPDARVREYRSNSLGLETRRTIRTVASGLATVWAKRNLLWPSHGWPSFFLWSHRIMRWASPFYLVLLFVSTWFTLQEPLAFGLLFYSQFGLYAVALLSWASSRYGQTIPIASTVEYFVAMNVSMLLGWFRFLSARTSDVWTPGKA